MAKELYYLAPKELKVLILRMISRAGVKNWNLSSKEFKALVLVVSALIEEAHTEGYDDGRQDGFDEGTEHAQYDYRNRND